VPPLIQAACYQLMLDRTLGEYHLPGGRAFFAAGNRKGGRAITARRKIAWHRDFAQGSAARRHVPS
jgi:hypothetical protein